MFINTGQSSIYNYLQPVAKGAGLLHLRKSITYINHRDPVCVSRDTCSPPLGSWTWEKSLGSRRAHLAVLAALC